MPQDAPRTLPADAAPFTRHAEAPLTEITHVEGEPIAGGAVALRQVRVTPGMVLVETRFPQGAGSRPHSHPDHDSIVYLVSGRMNVVVGDESWEAGLGDSWSHLPGVEHWMEALEPCVCVEVKAPPIRTW